MPVPNTFANATTSIPLSQLDANFATAITLGNTAIQLGNTVTTLNNMTMANVTITTSTVSGGTANGVAYLDANKALTTGTALVFDGANLGLGVTPSAWGALWKELQVGRVSVGDYNSAYFTLGYNAYESSGWKYIANGYASAYQQIDGAHYWITAASGTAGNTITWTTAMTLTAAGLLKVGSRTTIAGNTIYDPTSGGNDCGIGFGGGNTILPTDGAGNATTGTLNLGSGTYRWNTIYATNGTINTSDARVKTAIRPLTVEEVAAAKDLAAEIGAFKFLAAVEAKGDAARSHIGMTVQRAIEIMESHGLDPFAYGFICYDKWEDNVDGVIVTKSGDSYGFRPDELTLFLARGFEARLAALEAK